MILKGFYTGLENLMETTNDNGPETLVLKADKRVIGLLVSFLVTILGSGGSLGVMLFEIKMDIEKTNIMSKQTQDKQLEVLQALKSLHEDDQNYDRRLIRLEEWRAMTTDWQDKFSEANPTLPIPPAPDTLIPSTSTIENRGE